MIQADYAFLHSFGDSGDQVTVLIVVDTVNGTTIATACPNKGGDPFVEQFVRTGLESSGLIADVILRTARWTS